MYCRRKFGVKTLQSAGNYIHHNAYFNFQITLQPTSYLEHLLKIILFSKSRLVNFNTQEGHIIH